jgi:hypothetical protein
MPPPSSPPLLRRAARRADEAESSIAEQFRAASRKRIPGQVPGSACESVPEVRVENRSRMTPGRGGGAGFGPKAVSA